MHEGGYDRAYWGLPPPIHPRRLTIGDVLAKPNYQFEKRQRDLAKKSKQEEKRLRKLAGKSDTDAKDAVAEPQPPDSALPEAGDAGKG